MFSFRHIYYVYKETQVMGMLLQDGDAENKEPYMYYSFSIYIKNILE